MQTTIQQQGYRLALSTSNGICFFDPEQIIRMEASSSYTNIYFTDRRPIVASKVLKEYEELLEPYGFLRTHRSHLVNRKHIMQVDYKGNITMQDQSKAEISRRKKNAIMRSLKN